MNHAGQEPRKGNAPGRAVKVGKPGGRLAEELKMMQVSACAQGGKDGGAFHNMVVFRCNISQEIVLRYLVNNFFKNLSYCDNICMTLGLCGGESSLLERLVAELVALPPSGQAAIESHGARYSFIII
jgi:hypothetical protein